MDLILKEKNKTTMHPIASIALIILCTLFPEKKSKRLAISMKPAKNFYPFLLKITTFAKYSGALLITSIHTEKKVMHLFQLLYYAAVLLGGKCCCSRGKSPWHD